MRAFSQPTLPGKVEQILECAQSGARRHSFIECGELDAVFLDDLILGKKFMELMIHDPQCPTDTECDQMSVVDQLSHNPWRYIQYASCFFQRVKAILC